MSVLSFAEVIEFLLAVIINSFMNKFMKNKKVEGLKFIKKTGNNKIHIVASKKLKYKKEVKVRINQQSNVKH